MEINMAKLFHETPEDRLIEFFLQRDSIRNLDNEIAFTINPQYKCAINCNICFVKDWIKHDEFLKRNSNLEYSNEWKDKVFKSFQYFNEITTFDDFLYLKKFMPNQYSFYKENAHAFSMASFTDNGIFLLSDIILSELHFKEIYEMSFSSVFINQNCDKIIEVLEKLIKKYKIRYVKIIEQKSMTKEERIIYKKFLRFIYKQKARIVIMQDVLTGWEENKRNRCAIYAENGNMFHLLNGPLYLAYDHIYMDFKDHIKESSPYQICSLDSFCENIMGVIPALLEAKISKYRDQAKMIKNKNTRFFKYFTEVGETLKVNYDYNYIPFVLLRNDAKWLLKIIEKNEWELTDIGLINKEIYDGVPPVSVIEKV